MGNIEIEIDDLTYEVLYTPSIYGDEGTYDTPAYYEWEFDIDEIKVHGEYGDGQNVFLSELPQEHQDEIEESINRQISESIG